MSANRSLRAALTGAALVAIISPAAAQEWPTRPITAISPFSAGNANDIVGRVVLDPMSKQLGQPIVVENRPGGGGSVGANAVAKAAPDGYTILLHSSSFSAEVVLHKTLPYDPLGDFTAVIPFGAQPSVLVAAPSKGPVR